MTAYQTAIEQEINSQLKVASRLLALFYASPKFFSHFFPQDTKCCSGTSNSVQGARSIRDIWDLVKRFLGPRRILNLDNS